MCDISREENKAIDTQLAMKNIPLNSDVMSVIKSFLFYDKTVYARQKQQEMEQKRRKDTIIRGINSPEDNNGRPYVGGYYIFEHPEGFGHWSIWLPMPTRDGWPDLQMQGSNCLKCGKYVQVSTNALENLIVNNKYIMCVNGEH